MFYNQANKECIFSYKKLFTTKEKQTYCFFMLIHSFMIYFIIQRADIILSHPSNKLHVCLKPIVRKVIHLTAIILSNSNMNKKIVDLI